MNLEDEETPSTTVSDFSLTPSTSPFDHFTLRSSSVEQQTQIGFKPWKWNSPLSPIPKRRKDGDPLRHVGCRRKLTKSNYHENSVFRNQLQGILRNLRPESPFFLKSMIHCNVVHGFSLTLPKQFCYMYLPFDDTTIILEDKRGEEFRTVYLGDKRRLSGGWRKFCVAKNIFIGDLLVFHLVGPLKFKVYKVEPDNLTEVDATFNLLKLSLSTLFEECHLMPRKDIFQENICTTSLAIDFLSM